MRRRIWLVPLVAIGAACNPAGSGDSAESTSENETTTEPDLPEGDACEEGQAESRGRCWTRHDLGASLLRDIGVRGGSKTGPGTVIARTGDGEFRVFEFPADAGPPETRDLSIQGSLIHNVYFAFGSFSQPDANEVAIVGTLSEIAVVELESLEVVDLHPSPGVAGWGSPQTIGPGPDGRHRLFGSSAPSVYFPDVPAQYGVAAYALEASGWLHEWLVPGMPPPCGAPEIVPAGDATTLYVLGAFEETPGQCDTKLDGRTVRVEYADGVFSAPEASISTLFVGATLAIGDARVPVVQPTAQEDSRLEVYINGINEQPELWDWDGVPSPAGPEFGQLEPESPEEEVLVVAAGSGSYFAGSFQPSDKRLTVEEIAFSPVGTFKLADLNGDGATDLVIRKNGEVTVWLSVPWPSARCCFSAAAPTIRAERRWCQRRHRTRDRLRRRRSPAWGRWR